MNYFTKVIKLDGNITKLKNKALKEALKSPYDYFFLIEENCEVLNDEVFNKFIETSKATGIEALMWARADLNRKLPFEDDRLIQYWSDFVSTFSMYTRKVVETVGFMDEKMPPNTWQDIEYAKRIGDAGLSTPFGMFASPRGVDNYLKVTKVPNTKSIKDLEEALKYWESKEGDNFPIEIKKPMKEIREQTITEMI